MRELLSDWLPVKFGTSFQTGFTCFAGLAWALWTTRNKITIQKMFPEKSIIVVYNALSYIQKWRVQMKPLEKNSAMELTKRSQYRTLLISRMWVLSMTHRILQFEALPSQPWGRTTRRGHRVSGGR
jgi:hypothetical protein